MMWNEIDNLFTFKDSVEAQKFCAILDKYKEMEKEQAIKFALCYAFGQYNVSEDLKTHIEKFYQQTYGGNK
jgi:CO dehydrogenase/acetyl-CoA synthase beta subunit